jgi:predicted RNA-binding protein with TRAM domain
MKKPTVMIIGLGELGGRLLEYLVRVPNFGWRIVVAGRDDDQAVRKMHSAIFGASYWGLYPEVCYRHVDLADVAATASVLRQEAPDIIVNTTTLAAWWLRDLLPDHIRRKLDAVGAGPGLWAAGHLALVYNLMLAVRDAGISPQVVNSSYPDVVNVALARVGLAPTVGIGNIDLMIPAIQHRAAARFGVPMRHVVPYVVAHNFHSYNVLLHGTTHGIPFYLKIVIAGTDVTDRIDREAFLREIAESSPIPAAAGASSIAAGSLSKVVLALINDSAERTHAPGPLGLPGGYPVLLSQREVTLLLPADITLEQAVAINEEGQRADGIERIEADGMVVLTDKAQRAVKEMFGIELRQFKPEEAQSAAEQLSQQLRGLGERYGLRLRVH